MDKVFEINPLEIFNTVIEEVLLNLYNSKQNSDLDLEPHIIQAAKEDMKKLFENSNFDVDTISEQLNSKGWNEDKVKSFLCLIEEKKTEILYATILHHNSKYGQAVQNFDWALKIVKGVNELKTLSYPLLQLTISSINSKGEQKHTVYDLNKDMLCKLISTLEKKDNL